jgi:hypothetical protein
VQYLLVFVGCVLVLDALVGEKGLLEMVKKRQEYRALEQSLTDVRAENARLKEEANDSRKMRAPSRTSRVASSVSSSPARSSSSSKTSPRPIPVVPSNKRRDHWPVRWDQPYGGGAT